MTSVGETLRRERMRRNLDLAEISRELKISSRLLEAIENEEFDKLPGGVFAKAFVRQYAHLLDLDEEEMAAEVQRLIEPPPLVNSSESHPSVPAIAVPRVPEWETVGESRGWSQWSSALPALALVVVVMMVCSAVYAYLQRPRHPVVAQEAAGTAAAGRTEPAPSAAPPAEIPSAQAPQGPANDDAAGRSPEPPAQPAAAPAVGPRLPSESAAAPATAPVSGETSGTASEASRSVPRGPVHVELSATEPVWVLARADGKYLFSGTLDTNQTRTVDAGGTVVLRLGNAGGVNITLNGKALAPVGPKGQVRTVQLTSGGFQIVAPPVAPKSDGTPPNEPR
jgi:cytoskeleton protein RodZ